LARIPPRRNGEAKACGADRSSSRACIRSMWSARRPRARAARRPAPSPSCSAPRRTSGQTRTFRQGC